MRQCHRVGLFRLAIRQLAQKGELPFVKIGGKLRFDKADLQRYVEEHRHPLRAHAHEQTRPALRRGGSVPRA